MMWFVIDLSLVVLLIVIRAFVFAPVRVKGQSMMSTLHNGDLILVRVRRSSHSYRRGDIVICHYPGRYADAGHHFKQCFVKRIIGLPGETVSVEKGRVQIDDDPIDESSYLDPGLTRFQGNTRPKRVGRHRYYVMGDNRDHSNDSRRVGTIHRSEIIGNVVRVIHMPEWFGKAMDRADTKVAAALRRLQKQHKSR